MEIPPENGNPKKKKKKTRNISCWLLGQEVVIIKKINKRFPKYYFIQKQMGSTSCTNMLQNFGRFFRHVIQRSCLETSDAHEVDGEV